MTPINNNKMSEQELRKIISKIKCDDPYVGLDGRDVSKAIDELSTLISHERAEAVKDFRGGLIDYIEMYADDGKIKTTDDVIKLVEEYLKGVNHD